MGWRALFSSQVDSCFLPTAPSFTHSFFAPVVLFTCPTLLFVRPKFHLNNSIKDFSLLFSVGELSSFSFLLSLIRTLCLVPGASFSWGFEETRPHAREGVEWVELGLVQLVVGSGLGSSSVIVWICPASRFALHTHRWTSLEEGGYLGAGGDVFSGFGLFLQFKEVTAPRRSAPGVSFPCQTLLTSHRCFYPFPANGEKGTPVSFSNGIINPQQGKELHLGFFSPHSRSLLTLNTHVFRSYFSSLWLTPCLLLKVQ